jgi:protein TonB
VRSAAPLLLAVLTTTGCAATLFPPPARLVSRGCPETVHLPRPAPSITTAYLDSGVVCVDSIAPVYPAIAREASVDGTVLFEVLVCEHGRITETAVRKSIPMLDAAATEAVYARRYRPAYWRGHAVPCWTSAAIDFRLH